MSEEAVWVEARTHYSIDDVCDLSGLSRTTVQVLVETGALVDSGTGAARFAVEHVTLARAARRLRDHFELDENGLAVAVTLLRRVHVLEARLARSPGEETRTS